MTKTKKGSLLFFNLHCGMFNSRFFSANSAWMKQFFFSHVFLTHGFAASVVNYVTNEVVDIPCDDSLKIIFKGWVKVFF